MTSVADISHSAGDRSYSQTPPDSGDRKGRSRKHSTKRDSLRKSKFDSVSSMLFAIFVLVAICAFMLFIIWWDSRVYLPVKTLTMLIENPAGRGDNAEGFERDFEPPGAEEVEALTEPTMQDTISAVTDAVSAVAASLDTITSNASATTQGTGKGDSRPPGPEGEGEDIVPRSLRWQLDFSSKNLNSYAQQLDFYKIELAAIGGAIQGVDYASSLASTPKIRRAPSDGEKRLYFMWTTESPLKRYDQQLLQKAGIPTAGRQMIKFLEPDIENLIANIELNYAKEKGHQSVTEIAKTVFESRAANGGYEFVVTEQRYRKPKK